MDKGIVDVLERGEGERIEFKSAYTNRVGRTICAFANTKGGTIYLGISDKGNNRSERAVGIKDPHDVISKVQDVASSCDPPILVRINKKPVDSGEVGSKVLVVVEVDQSAEPFHKYNKDTYQRVGDKDKPLSTAELNALLKGRSGFDESFCAEFDYQKNFDQEKLNSMLNHNNSASEKDAIEAIIGLGAGIKRNGHVIFRNAGVLFFAKNLNVFYPHASIRCFRFRGADESGEIIAKNQFNDDLISSMKKALVFLEENLNTAYRFSNNNMRREELLELPQIALREAIVNAVTHRNYLDKGAETTIKIFDNRVEITNPCVGMRDGASTFKFSTRVNPLIATLMDKAGHAERIHRGIELMKSAVKKVGQSVIITIENNFWNLTFTRKKHGHKVSDDFNFGDDYLSANRSKRLAVLLDVIARHKFDRHRFIADNNVNEQIVDQDLGYLQAHELVTIDGSGPSDKYNVTTTYLCGRETKLSPCAVQIARFLVERSEIGDGSEWHVPIEKINDKIPIDNKKILTAIDELEQIGLVGLAFVAGHSIPTSIMARAKLFVEFDQFWMPWNPKEDARTITSDLMGEEGQEIAPSQIAERYGWNLRRVNPAIQIIRKNALRFMPSSNVAVNKFELPEHTRFSWDRGKDAAEDFLRHIDSDMHKEDSIEEVVLLMCLRSTISYLFQKLYGDVVDEKISIEGIPHKVYFASTPEKERKIKFLNYLQKLISDIEREEIVHGK